MRCWMCRRHSVRAAAVPTGTITKLPSTTTYPPPGRCKGAHTDAESYSHTGQSTGHPAIGYPGTRLRSATQPNLGLDRKPDHSTHQNSIFSFDLQASLCSWAGRRNPLERTCCFEFLAMDPNPTGVQEECRCPLKTE